MRMLRMSGQALSAMLENKTRTFLMMLGVIIGVATLTAIASSVLGAREEVMGKVEKFGLNQLMVMAGSGRKPGVPQPAPTTLKADDAQAMLSEINNVAEVSPQINRRDVPVKYLNKSTYAVINAANSNWASVWSTRAETGRFFSDEDSVRLARVAVIGRTIQKDLFEGDDPLGQQILLGNNPFEVIGVLESRGSSPTGLDMDSRIIIPLTTGQKRVFNLDYVTQINLDFANKSRKT